MDKLPTIDVRGKLALAGIALMAGACDFGDTPDPRMLAKSNPPPVIEVEEMSIQPATGRIYGYASAPPAPMAEAATLSRSLKAPVEELVVAVGRNAQASFDKKLRSAYEGTLTNQTVQHIQSSDREVVELLMMGRADFGLIGGSLSQREIQNGLRQTQVGVELFALSISPLSSVRSLSRSQVRQIFTGQVTDWQQLGFDSGAIVAVVPSDSMVAQRAERTLMPGDAFASTCLRVSSERHLADQILQHAGAIGIVRITAGAREPGQKLIQVDWTPPTPAAFGYGTYPFGIPLQLVTSGMPGRRANDFLAFAESELGRSLFARTLTFAR
ncbi:MAG: phosphate transport system substrate-binding protein [Planctomycetota bacterium]